MSKPVQLDLLDWLADIPAKAIRERREAFRRRLADAGMPSPQYDGNGSILNPLGYEHPSRLLKLPLHARNERVYIVHPGLADEPFVDEVERRLGERPVYDDCISDRRRDFESHHALDLCQPDRYRLLLDSMHLTTLRAVVETVGRELRAACEPKFAITAAIAREILTAIGMPETSSATNDVLLAAIDREWRLPIGLEQRTRDFATLENAWECIHAYERGLVRRDRNGRAVPVKLAVDA